MSEEPKSEGTPVVATGTDRFRSGLADAGGATRRALGRLRREKRSEIAEAPEPGSTSAADDTLGSPTDLADADVSVRRAWRNVRLVIAIVVTVAAPVVTALISWRIRVSRARRRGHLVDL
jgi:hypothetical protein